ncbi:MAG: acyl transferase [Bacteroidia bacterium]|nr:acyl transferase [Bacteroidia bacterium]
MQPGAFTYSVDIFGESFDFRAEAERLWQHYLAQNAFMKTFAERVGGDGPLFMPIRLFGKGNQKGIEQPAQAEFRSSGTSGGEGTLHRVFDLELYRKSLLHGFRHFYGDGKFTVLALLPNYLEQGSSSLVFMVNEWILNFGNPGSGFFLYEFKALYKALQVAASRGERILLIGVSYALLDFAEQFPLKLPENAIVMETGGMKGRRREMVRGELHEILQAGLGVKQIHSEYGMTELLSQAYSQGNGHFRTPPWMKVVISDLYLPQQTLPCGQSGRINIIDLANSRSHPFLSTDDVGRQLENGTFEVLGRIDRSQLRGCNLLYA